MDKPLLVVELEVDRRDPVQIFAEFRKRQQRYKIEILPKNTQKFLIDFVQ